MIYSWWNINWSSYHGKSVWMFLYTCTKHICTYTYTLYVYIHTHDLMTKIYHSCVCTEGTLSRQYRDTCLSVFLPALFMTVRKWNQPRWPSTGEQIKKMYIIYTQWKANLAIKKTDIKAFAGKEMKLETIVLNKARPRVINVFSLICRP